MCGPTVYDHIHIGNIAPVIIFDFLIRYIREKNIQYTYIHNITDIDDKIIDKAFKESKTEEEISGYYLNEYLKILGSMNIIQPTIMPKVSEHIEDIQNVISELENKNYTSLENGDISFRLDLVSEYGELSKQKLDSLTNLSDFCLWKKTDLGKKWNSKWGEGRPGWHTECFAFIHKYANGTVDIHGGGVDLKFPHHENENAHCRALCNKPLANIWVHIGHLSTQDGKISKSTNKKFLVKDLLKKYSSNEIRYLFLTNKYSSPLLISEEKFEDIRREMSNYYHSINKSKSILFLNGQNLENNIGLDPMFLNILEDDLNLPNVLTWIQKIHKNLNSSIKQKSIHEIKDNCQKLMKHMEWLGFIFEDIHTEEAKRTLKEWQTHLDNKDYEKADEARKILIEQKLI